MYKKFKKLAAVILVSTMLVQSGMQGFAEEMPTGIETQAPTEAQTQAPTEAPTEAQTQAPTEAPTEAQTQAPTEAPTEAQTQAPTETPTEAQTEAPTEAQTQAPTEAQTQAPTEAPTEAQSETQVPSETEDQTGEKQTEKETERSERVNTGKKLKSSDITASLRAALPYLFAAGTVEGPEELLKDQEIAAGAEGSAVASGLADFSKKLANAVSSSDVEVINLYADKKGRLDTAQLDQRYSNHVIDVSKKYYVVNIIADHADQTLDFSGYAMVLSGERVTYDDEAQPGDILYNFAALDGKGYTGYKGTVTLANGAGLQGTFLAPEAGVNVNSNLAGAVYAKRVSVAGSVTELLQIAFVEGRQPEETAVTEGPSTEEATEAEIPKPQKAPSQKAPVTKAVMETEPETPPTKAETETETPPTKAETETETPPTKAETQQNETAGEAAGAKTLLETEEELLEAAGNLAETESVPYSDDKIVLNVKLVKAGQDKVPLTQGTVTVKAAITVLNKDNTVKYHAGDTVSSAAVSSSDSVKAGDGLTKGGRYYLELSGLPENYCNIQRICFSVGDDGIPVFEPSDSGVIMENGTLIITLYDQAQIDQVQESALLTVKKGDAQEADISNAVFVLKDSDKKIIRDTVSGNPSYYIHYAGTPILLTGLTVGKYYLSQISTEDGYQIAEEQPFEIKKDAGALVELSITNDPVSGENALKVFAQAYGNEQLLTAESDMKTKYYAALFKDKEAASRVSAVKEIIFDKDEQSSNELLFGGLEDGTYYLVPTNELGETLTDISSQITDTEGADLSAGISFAADSDSSEKTKGAVLRYKFLTNETVDTYPNGDFSYMATINLTNKLINYDGTELTGKDGDVFQIELYKDADRTQKVTSEPITFDMKGVSSASQTYSLKMTVGSAEYYLAESQTGQNLYTVSLPGNDGRIIVTCGSEPVNVEIQNKLNDTEVRLRLVDNDSGQYISDVFMVIKDKDGRIVSDNGKALVFKSGKKDYTVTNLLSGGQTYYLSQVAAPSGYAPTADVSFEVQRGTVSEVEMRAVRAVTTDYTVTVLKQVYSGKNQVYAQDDTSGTNAAKGRYTFYAALFADAAHTQKVSNVQKITVKGLGGSTVFQNLAPDTTYYVAETNVYGEPKVSTATQTIKYANGGKVSTTEKNRSTVIQNVYSGLPKGYRYTARLTLAKKVTKASGEAAAVTENFYAGIFRKADYSDKPTVIKLDLQNASSTYVSRRILLPDNAQTTYYIAEVNADGSRINTETFGYTPEISTPVLKISAGDDTSVTITNKEKSSKVTLYLTKKVYQGVTQKAVNETFYAGLFKDAKYTQLYTKPIPLNMNGKSELSLKLSLNLGSASNANIYVAEVDKDGKVIKDEEAFGYEIRVVNATAAFTQEKREIQTILLNSVYGSASQADWDQLLGSGSGFSGEGGGVISGNGEVGEAAQTGDDTPITLYLALMAAAVVLIVVIILLKKKRRS